MEAVSDFFASFPSDLEIHALGRLLLALLLGAAVGLERELSAKPAGLRTVILICVGAELLTEASLLAAGFQIHELVRADPARIAAQIVTGIGFIGAGTILVYRGSVVGLTTAATLWVTAAIGMTIGLRAYVIAVGATILVVSALVLLGWIERRFVPDWTVNTLTVTLYGSEATAEPVKALLDELGFKVELLEIARAEEGVTLGYWVSGTRVARGELLDRLSADPLVRSARVD